MSEGKGPAKKPTVIVEYPVDTDVSEGAISFIKDGKEVDITSEQNGVANVDAEKEKAYRAEADEKFNSHSPGKSKSAGSVVKDICEKELRKPSADKQ